MDKAKTVLITGASSGIGKAAAVLFANRGWNVAAAMRTPEKEHLLKVMQNVIRPKMDVTDRSSIRSAAQETVDQFGKIDVLVNNAGYSLTGAFETLSEEEIRRQFETNVFGLMNVTSEILPLFRESKSGTVINISSMGGKIAFPFMSIYHSTKWAVEGFTESLHYEMSLFNVRVKLVEPGPVKTNFYGGSMQFGSKKIKEYDKYFENFQKLSDNAERMGFPPIRTAQEIYRAATDGSWKLRYPSDLGAKSVLLMRKVLPDKLYNSIIRSLSRPR